MSPEHAASLCRCYEEKQSSLQARLRACSLRGECRVGLGFLLEGACGLGAVYPQKGYLTTSRQAVTGLGFLAPARVSLL